MKSKHLLGIAILLVPLFLLIDTARADLPSQTRPTNIEPFLGRWEGTWNHKGASGGVIADLSKLAGDTVRFQATLAGTRSPDSYEAPAKFSAGQLNVELPVLTMVFRLHGSDNLEVSYIHNGDPGTYSLTRQQTKMAAAPPGTPTPTMDALLTTLVTGSPWSGEFGPRPVGTLTVHFTNAAGSLSGEVTAINAGTSKPGPVTDIQVAGDKVSFKMPGNNVQVDLGLKGQKLEGTWFGTSSGWMALMPSKR